MISQSVPRCEHGGGGQRGRPRLDRAVDLRRDAALAVRAQPRDAGRELDDVRAGRVDETDRVVVLGSFQRLSEYNTRCSVLPVPHCPLIQQAAYSTDLALPDMEYSTEHNV